MSRLEDYAGGLATPEPSPTPSSGLIRTASGRLRRRSGNSLQGSVDLGRLVGDLRKRLEAAGVLKPEHDDSLLKRFLAARAFDLDKAEVMFVNMVNWRKEFGTDTILHDFDFPEMKKVMELYPHGHHNTDKWGHPVYIEKLGQLKVKQLMEVTNMERMLRNHVYEWEKLLQWKWPAASQAVGHNIDKSFTVLDFEGNQGILKFYKEGSKFLKYILQVDADYYPEVTLFKMFIINVPWTFKQVWSIVKPWIDPKTASKIEVHGKDYKKALLEYVDESALPQFLGGTCVCPGGDCLACEPGPWRDFPKPWERKSDEQPAAEQQQQPDVNGEAQRAPDTQASGQSEFPAPAANEPATPMSPEQKSALEADTMFAARKSLRLQPLRVPSRDGLSQMAGDASSSAPVSQSRPGTPEFGTPSGEFTPSVPFQAGRQASNVGQYQLQLQVDDVQKRLSVCEAKLEEYRKTVAQHEQQLIDLQGKHTAPHKQRSCGCCAIM
eukprot:jgi/Chlat1/2239/Chrsp17S02783